MTREIAEKYHAEGVARQVLRNAGIDYTGQTVGEDGQNMLESATDTVRRMADTISQQAPESIKLLETVGIFIET